MIFQVLEAAGFKNVKAEDRTDLFVKSLEKELDRAETIKDEFLQVIPHRLMSKKTYTLRHTTGYLFVVCLTTQIYIQLIVL